MIGGTMTLRVAPVASDDEVARVVVAGVPVEMVNGQSVSHRPSPVDPLLTPVAAMRAEPDLVEQHEPLQRHDAALAGKDMLRHVQPGASACVDDDVPVAPLRAALALDEVAVAPERGVVVLAHPLGEVGQVAAVDLASPRGTSRLDDGQWVPMSVPTPVVNAAPTSCQLWAGAVLDHAFHDAIVASNQRDYADVVL